MKIYNYNNFVNEEKKHFSSYENTRSESLDHLYSVKDIESLLKKYTPWFLEDINIDSRTGNSKFLPVYRGVERNDNFLKVSPSLYNRVSRNTENYYTLIIDDSWVGYPKRQKSIIATTSIISAEKYGNGIAYRVIPIDKKSNFGIASDIDFWLSFKEGIKYINEKFKDFFEYTDFYKTGISLDLNNLNAFLKDCFGLTDYETIETLKEKITVYNFVDNNHSMLFPDGSEDENYDMVNKLESISINGSLYHIFEKALSTDINTGFRNVKYNETVRTDYEKEKEVWTDGECLMIDSDIFDSWMKSKFKIPISDKFGWPIKNGLSTDPSLKTDAERRKRVEESK